MLTAYQKDKGQQCHKENPQIIEAKFVILHMHHLPFLCKMEGQPPVHGYSITNLTQDPASFKQIFP